MARTAGSHADVTGPRVRAAALRLFAQHGFAAVSMRQIAAEVGVQAGALYNYTPDKQSLLFDLMHSHMEDVIAGWNAQHLAGTPLERLESFARFHVRFHLERPEAVFISYMELRNLAPENFAKVQALRKSYENVLNDILLSAREAGEIRVEDSKVTTYALIAMLTGVNTWFRDAGRLNRAEVEDLYWDMTRNAVGAQAQ